MATIAELSNHPNIVGIKCSGDLNDSLELMECVDDGFRVIVAKADQVDVLCQQGIVNHLDGIFSLVPEWIVDIAECPNRQQAWDLTSLHQALRWLPSSQDDVAGIAQLVERQLPKLNVVGSSPIARS